MKIDAHDINERIFIIAEIGNNHEGDVRLAHEMISAAAESGADAVKFQTIIPELLVSATDGDRVAQLRRFQLSQDDFVRLAEQCRREKVTFLSTPFFLEAVDWLDDLVPAYKISSSDNTFFPLLRKVASTGKPVLLSTGLADEHCVQAATACLQSAWQETGTAGELALLHCVSAYPTPATEAHLARIQGLSDHFGRLVGYSDHTLGIEACVQAVAYGARVIEKHFTLNKQQSEFRDHQLSADPEDLKELVQRIRTAEQMIGKSFVQTQQIESSNAPKWRRSIVAARDLTAGEKIHMEDLTWVRPGDGLAPGREAELIGTVLKCDIVRGKQILLSDVAVAPLKSNQVFLVE